MMTAPSSCKAQAQGAVGPRLWSSPRVRPSSDSLLPFLSVSPQSSTPREPGLHSQSQDARVNIIPHGPHILPERPCPRQWDPYKCLPSGSSGRSWAAGASGEWCPFLNGLP